MNDRIISETGVEERVARLVEPLIGPMGYRLVRIRLSGQNGSTLQIMAERNDGTMAVEDCEELSRVISPMLDVEDPIPQSYYLEVSSPGIDRPMVRRSDFADWSGHLAKVETSVPVEGRRKFRGFIEPLDEAHFRLRLDDGKSENEAERIDIAFDLLVNARLVLTDELIRESLRRDKALRKAAGRDDVANDNDALNDNDDGDHDDDSGDADADMDGGEDSGRKAPHGAGVKDRD